jgi:cysteine protease ATG4
MLSLSVVDVMSTRPDPDDVCGSYVLGKLYHPIHGYAAHREDEASLIGWTYRSDFEVPIQPYEITTDAGWGCMLRAAQMLLTQALRMHFHSRNWRPPRLFSHQRQDPLLRSLLTWFADYPDSSSHFSIYSLHNMVATGHARYEKLPGEWYGPQTVCFVLRDLVDLHEAKQSQWNDGLSTAARSGPNQRQQKPIFRVHVADQGCVYRDLLHHRMARQHVACTEQANLRSETQKVPLHPLDWDDELVGMSDCHCVSNYHSEPWDTACLLLIPLRLGVHAFNPDYVQIFTYIFSLPQSVGVLGGRPRGARWFYGVRTDGSKILGLDPHIVQPSPRRRYATVNNVPRTPVVDLSNEYLHSVHSAPQETCALLRMDPSIALGFYCRDAQDFEILVDAVQRFREQYPGTPELFSVNDKSPDYATFFSNDTNGRNTKSTNVTSLLDDDDDDFEEKCSLNGDLSANLNDSDNDDDFVLL